MAETVYLEEADRYILVREVADLGLEDRGHVVMIARKVAEAGLPGADEDEVRTAVTMLYDLADVVTWLEPDEVKDLTAKSVITITNTAIENANTDEFEDVPPEAILDG